MCGLVYVAGLPSFSSLCGSCAQWFAHARETRFRLLLGCWVPKQFFPYTLLERRLVQGRLGVAIEVSFNSHNMRTFKLTFVCYNRHENAGRSTFNTQMGSLWLSLDVIKLN
jgi:hypothetical protein